MKIIGIVISFVVLAHGQVDPTGKYAIAFPEHTGKFTWSAPGFQIIQASAKPKGIEIGLRGRDASGRLTFLAFLFLVPEAVPLNSAKCRDGALDQEKKGRSSLKIASLSQVERPGSLPIATAFYSAAGQNGSVDYFARAFLATGDTCGDLEIYSKKPLTADDSDVNTIISSLELDAKYKPVFADSVFYGQVQYRDQDYKSAAFTFERAIGMVPPDGKPFPSATIARRVVIDQAGMSYGISGDLNKARSIFENALKEDPEYPMYYYNLACADAQEKKLADARNHLKQAFDRRANMNSGEQFPDPTKDDSFLPYRGNRDFWAFLEGLRSQK